MELNRATTFLKGATVGGLLIVAGLAMPGAASAANGDYGGGPGVTPPQVTPPQTTPPQVTPPQVSVPQVTPPQATVPQVPQSVPQSPIGGGGRSSVGSSSGSLSSVSPVSASVSPVNIAARPAAAAPPPAPAPISDVLGRTIDVPEVPAPLAVVAPRPILEETAPRVAFETPVEEAAPRTVQREVCVPGVGGAGLGPDCGQVLGRTLARPAPGLVMARVLPKAGEGLGEQTGIWPPLALAGAGLALAVVAMAWPRRRRSAQVA